MNMLTKRNFRLGRLDAAIEDEESQFAMEAKSLSIYYGDFKAVNSLSIGFEKRKVTALIGPSGCGKSTALRAFNRMNELISGVKTEGEVLFHGVNVYDPDVDAVQVRQIGRAHV